MVSGKESTFLGMKSTLSDGNLNKTHLLHFGVLSMFLGSSLVRPWSFTRGRLERYRGKES